MLPAAAQQADVALGTSADDEQCIVQKQNNLFETSEQQLFARILLRRAGAGDRLLVEWIAPDGSVSDSAEYNDLPAAARVCVLTRLSVAGFAAASEPGNWALRASLNGTRLASKPFVLKNAFTASHLSVASAAAKKLDSGDFEISLTGAGFDNGDTVHIARFSNAGGWKYLAAELPVAATQDRITVRTRKLDPGEYIAVVRALDGTLSPPARFLVSTGRAYRMPTPAGERWIVTQRPYGPFSHWNRSLHAWDIAPQGGRFVVAMRAGTVHTHDLGLGRTPYRRSFGNYITIDHGDGEYSHYAHLATGGFLVHNGDHVEQGQPIAVVGNSGYTFGGNGGYHVHVHVTRFPAIAAQSIPFSFDEAAQPAPAAASIPSAPGQEIRASVQPTQWWSDLIAVPVRALNMRVELAWDGADADLDLHLVSPTGRHYGWYGKHEGYSGSAARPERFEIPAPEPGRWRIAVQGVRGVGTTEFRVRTDVAAPSIRRRLATRR